MVHPDLCTTHPDREKAASAAASARINVGHKALKNPATRAQYLLKLHGLDALGEGAGTTGVSPQLLMQVMEAREAILDPDTPRAALSKLRDRNAHAVKLCSDDLSKAFRAGDLVHARAITIALQYYTKIEDEIVTRMEKEEEEEDAGGKGRGGAGS
jgi:molecular chaperone HscB